MEWKDYDEARDDFGAAVTRLRDAYRAFHETTPGVVTGWTVLWTESKFNDDGDDEYALTYQSNVAGWQTIGMLDLAKSQCTAWILRDSDA